MRRKSFFIFVSWLILALPCHTQAQQKPPTSSGSKEALSTLLSTSAAAEAFKEQAFKFYEENKNAQASENLSLYIIFDTLDKSETSISQALTDFFVSSPDIAEEFSQIISPKDNAKKVFEILDEIYSDSPENFKKYPRLAIAIAVVFDMPPPDAWPHHQVSEEILPRKLWSPLDAFKARIDPKNKGRFLIQPDKLSIEEAKYLVSSIASPADWDWVRKSVSINIANLPKLYSSISYDKVRLNSKKFHWQAADYKLETIKKIGGICVDQAYYTAEVAKIRGVPAFVFSGAGADGFHAWVGYMQKSGSWNFGVGRYESSRFVTGHAIDPQTWERASDHALSSMSERFRESPKYKTNLYHASFAKKFLEMENWQKAEASAKKAISSDARNADAWDIILVAAEKQEKNKSEIVSLYESAIKAFARYPDTEADYRKRLIALHGKDNTEAARKVSSSMITKTRRDRPDLAMEFARADIESDISEGNTEKLYSSYKRLINMFKADGASAINGILVPVAKSLMMKRKFNEARELVKITEQSVKVKGNVSIESTLVNIKKWIDENEVLMSKPKASE